MVVGPTPSTPKCTAPVCSGGSTLNSPLKAVLQEIEALQEEIQRELQRITDPKEYEVLLSFFPKVKSNPYIHIIRAYALKVFYWDIERFHSEDAFVSYMLMGGSWHLSGKEGQKMLQRRRRGVKGKKDAKSWKTETVRKELMAFLYALYDGAKGKGSSKKLYAPLREHVRRWKRGRLVAFLDILLRLLYRGLKEGKTLPELLSEHVERLEEEVRRWKVALVIQEDEKKRRTTQRHIEGREPTQPDNPAEPDTPAEPGKAETPETPATYLLRAAV